MTAAELGRAYFDALDRGDVQGAAGALAEDVELFSPGGRLDGREQVRPFLEAFADALPDAAYRIHAVFEGDDGAVFEGVYEGTHTGPLRTPDGSAVPPSGQRVSLPFTVAIDGRERITSYRGYWDQLTFLAQLGLIPSP
jgi:steroid delta-isomerase-like uncharacterized protein